MDDNRKWIYDSLKGKGVDLGSYEDYDKALDSDDSRKWVYDSAKKSGIDMGSYDDFSNAIDPVPSSIRRPSGSNGEGGKPVVATQTSKRNLNLSDEADLSMSGWIGSKPYNQDISIPKRSTTQMLKPQTFESVEKEDTQRYMSDPARQIDTEERGLKQDIAEQRKVNEDNAPKGLWNVIKNVILNGPQTYEQRTSSPDIEAAEKRLRELEVYKTAVQEDRDGDNQVQKGIGEAGRQLPETLRSIGTLGLSRVVDAIKVARNKGEDVGPLEKSANELYDKYTQLNRLDDSIGRDIASGALQSAEYATQFAATGGLAAGATEGLGKIVASKLGGRLAAKAAGGAAEAIGNAVARTTIMPSTYSTAVDIMNQTGAGFPDAWGQSFTQNVIENFSEGVGEFMPSVGMSKNKFARRFMHASGIQGFPQEFAEEQIGTVLHAMAGDGQGKWSDLIDPRNQLTTAGVLAVMQIPHVSIASGSYVSGKAGNKIQNYSINKAYSKNLVNLQDQFGGNEPADSGEIIDFVNKSIDNARSGKDMDALLDYVTSDDNLTDDQRDAIAKYALAYNAKAAMDKGKEDAVSEKISADTEDIKANSDPSTWIYTEANRLVPNEVGEFVPVPGYIVGHIGDTPLWKPEGSGPDVQAVPLKPHEIQDVQSMPTQEVIDASARMIQDESKANDDFESRYDPQIQPPAIGTSFGKDGAQIEIVQQNPNGGWIANMTTIDEKGKPQAQVVEITDDDYYNAKQQDLDAQENINLSDLQQENESYPGEGHNNSLRNNENQQQEDNAPETTTVQKQQEVPASQIIYKKDAKGNDTDEVDFESMPVENTISHLNSLTGNDESTAKSVEKTYTKANSSLESSQKALDKIESEGVDYTDRKEVAAYQKAKEAVASAKARVDYWSTVNDELQSSRIQPGDKTAEAIRTMGEPVNGEELAATMLANGNLPILFSDYKKETGYSNSEGRKMVGLFANKANGGMSVQEAGEKLMLADQENGTNFFDQSDPNAGRNAILDVLSQANTRGDIFSYIQSNREALAEREKQAEYNAYSTWVDENYHMTPEDYEIYEEVLPNYLADKSLSDDEYNQFMYNFADEQLNNNENDNTGRIGQEIASDEQRGIQEDSERSGEVLPKTQSLPSERAGEAETGSSEADERVNNENDTSQGSASTREFVAPEYKGGNLLDYAEQISKQKEIHDAGNEVDTNPTEARKEAGNYKKGHIKIDGLDISIENPKGSERSGVDKSGKKWSISMNNDYGYIRGTQSVDGDHIDVFLGPELNSPNVYVVDQVNSEGSFDEHKVMYGFSSIDEAREAYLSNYEDGWRGLGNITEISKDNFKRWIDSSTRKTKPFAEYKIAQSEVPAMSEEEYLASKGYGSLVIGEPALAKGRQRSEKQQNKIVEMQSAKDKEYSDKREELRKEYRQKVESGELREPTTVEKLIKVANGNPDLESTQAARRSLKKRGMDWENTEKRFRTSSEYTPEEQTIVDNAKANGTYLKTPNGKDTNLTPKQWAQVRTDAFKKWFGDWEHDSENASKVVDENGEPMVVYHGSSRWFTVFNDGRVNHQSQASDGSIFASNDREIANSYIGGNWYGESGDERSKMSHDVYLDENDPRHSVYDWGVYREGGIYPIFMNLRNPLVLDFGGKAWRDTFMGKDINGIVSDEMKSGMHDGVIAKNIVDVGATDLKMEELPQSVDYIAFESSQIKSATDNTGKFDSGNNDIRYRTGEQTNNEPGKTVTDAVQSLSEKLNTPVHVINSIEELPEDVRARVEKGQRIKAWYDIPTDEVFLYAPNAGDEADINKSVLHEIVGHKGLRALFGDRFDNALQDIYSSLPKDVRAKIAQAAVSDYSGDTSIATEEYLAEQAEKGDTPTWWNKVIYGIQNFLRSIGINVEMSDNDVKYLLWRSRKNLESSDLLSVAEDINMRRKMGIGEDEINKNYDTALHVAKDFSDNHAGSGSVFIVKSPSTIRQQLKAIGIEDEDIDRYEDWMKEGETRAFFSPKYDRIIVLDASASKEKLNSYLWHESTHKALSGLDSRDDIVKTVSDFVRDNIPDIYAEVEDLYKDSEEHQKREECTSFFVEALLANGKESLMNEGNVRLRDKKVNDAISEILNRINNGSESKKNQNEPRDIRRRGSGENSGSGSTEVEVRNPEGSKRFRTEEEHPSDGTRESYENALNEKGFTGYQAKEAYQDSMLSLKILQDVISNINGKSIKSFENAYLAENRMSSVSTREMEVYAKDYFRPLVEDVARMIKDEGVSYRDITDYLIAKHGLERNQILAERDAEKSAIDSGAEKGSKDYEDVYNDQLERNLQNDYSGLTGLMKSLTDEKENPTAFAKGIVSYFESKHNTDNLWKRIHEATEKTLRKSYESGMISLDQYNELRNRFKNYVPLRGWDETMADEVYNYLDGKRSPVNSVMKGAKGRTSLADDPIATIGNMAESTILEGNRNVMKQHFLNFVTNHPSDLATTRDVWYVKDNATDEMIPSYPNIPDNATPDEVAKAVEAHEHQMEELEKQGLSKRGRNGLDLRYKILPYQKSEHAVTVKRNGREQVVYINANPRAAQALNGKTNPDVENNPIFRAIGSFNRALAKNFTTRNPAFVLSNLSRDLIFAHSAVSIKESPMYLARFSTNVPTSISTVFKGVRGIEDNSEAGKYFQEFLDNGGETGYANLRDVDRYKKMVQNDIKHLTKKDYFKAVRDGAELFNDFNRIAENISRFNTYLTSRQEGKDVVESIKDAKEITVNFNKKGSGYKSLDPKQVWFSKGNVAAYSAGAMRNLFLFFNAGVQSLANFGNLAKKNAGKFGAVIGGFTAAGFMMPFINKWLMDLGGDGDDQDYYQNLTEWTRRNNLCIYIPYSKGDFVTIPLPIELRAFFGLGDMAYQSTIGNSDKKGTDIAFDAINQLTELLPLNPLGNNGDITSTVIPDALKPVWQVHENKDFTGRPVFKENGFNENMPEWTKTYKGNSKMLIKLAEWSNEIGGGDKYMTSDVEALNWNPAKLEHILEGYFGGMATTLNQTGKTLYAGVESAVKGEKSDDLTVSNAPVLNRFIKDASDDRSSFKAVREKFYNYLKEYEDTEKNLRGYTNEVSSGNIDYLSKLVDLQKSKDYQVYATFKALKKPLDKIRQLEKKVGEDNSEELVQQRNELMKIVVGELDKIK